MLKELQEKLQLEVERLQTALVDSVKKLLNIEGISAQVAPDLSRLNVLIDQKNEEPQRIVDTRYVFTTVFEQDKAPAETFSGTSTVVIIQGSSVAGTITNSAPIAKNVIDAVFYVIQQFRAEELAKQEKEAAPAEESAPTPEVQTDELF